jgi:hypothetical protein
MKTEDCRILSKHSYCWLAAESRTQLPRCHCNLATAPLLLPCAATSSTRGVRPVLPADLVRVDCRLAPIHLPRAPARSQIQWRQRSSSRTQAAQGTAGRARCGRPPSCAALTGRPLAALPAAPAGRRILQGISYCCWPSRQQQEMRPQAVTVGIRCPASQAALENSSPNQQKLARGSVPRTAAAEAFAFDRFRSRLDKEANDV